MLNFISLGIHLSIWRFTFGSEIRWCRKLWQVIGKLSWLKQTLRFCKKLIYVSCLVTFFSILGIQGLKIDPTLVFPQIFW